MLCFARLIRCAIVASGTRNAFAISAVVRPPTARSVSAIADADDSAGWQHMNSRTSVSSGSIAGLGIDRRRNDERNVLGRHGLAIAAGHLAAHVIGHAPQRHVDQPAARIVRHAVARPLRGRGDQRLLHGVLARGEVAEPPQHRAEHLRREIAQQVLGSTVAAT